MPQQDEQSHGQANGNGKAPSVSELTFSTLLKVAQRRRRSMHPETRCTFYDNSFPGYGWLFPGWVAEERRVKSGRIYRYYHDPSGCLYRSQHQVIHAWEDLGLIVLDK